MRNNHSTEHPSLTKKADAGLSSRRHRTNKDFNVYPRQVDILPGVKRPVGPASCRIVIQFADCQESHRSAFFHRYIVRVYSWTQDSAKHSTSTCSSMFFRVESLQRNNLHQLKTTTLSLLLAFRLSSVHHYREAKQFFFFTCFLHALFWAAHTWALLGAHPLVIRADNTKSKQTSFFICDRSVTSLSARSPHFFLFGIPFISHDYAEIGAACAFPILLIADISATCTVTASTS